MFFARLLLFAASLSGKNGGYRSAVFYLKTASRPLRVDAGCYLRRMEISQLISDVSAEVKALFSGEGTGHDWEHIKRVHRTAVHIANMEGADQDIAAAGALLHDIADHKFHGGSLTEGPSRARDMLLRLGSNTDLAERVALIVSEVSYKGAGVPTPVSTPEAAAVQDADRLDAMGAIGVARAFAYGGSKGRALYTPDDLPRLHDSFEDYANDSGAVINHFYEKLLLLKDRMNTAEGRRLAEERHAFLRLFLDAFLQEWEGGHQ